MENSRTQSVTWNINWWINKKDQEELFRELEKANTNAAHNEGRYNRETGITKSMNHKIGDFERQIQEHKDGQKDFVNRTRSKINDYQNEINSKEGELASLKARLHQKAEEVKIAQIGMISNKNKAIEFADQNLRKEVEIDRLNSEVSSLRQDLVDTTVTRQSEGTALLEVEHLKADNDRLIKLLQKTKEYKNFSRFALDNLGAVRYMPNSKNKKCAVKH